MIHAYYIVHKEFIDLYVSVRTFISNGKSVSYGTHDMDTPGCYRMHICLAIKHAYNMVI